MLSRILPPSRQRDDLAWRLPLRLDRPGIGHASHVRPDHRRDPVGYVGVVEVSVPLDVSGGEKAREYGAYRGLTPGFVHHRPRCVSALR